MPAHEVLERQLDQSDAPRRDEGFVHVAIDTASGVDAEALARRIRASWAGWAGWGQ